MKIIDAYWEKRNLGVDVIEVVCNEKDDATSLRHELLKINVPYSVVKIPAGCPALLIEAQNCGYQIIETGIELWGDIQKIKTPDIYSRFIPHITMERANGKTLDYILNKIKYGDIFETDRIAVDSYFSKEIAGQRYFNWAKDVLTAGGFMAVLYYKDVPVAFNLSQISKYNNSAYDGIVGGLLPAGKGKGLGFLVVHAENEICKLHNGKYCVGRVSSNNLPMLRLHLQFGYEVKSITNVLVKHQ